MASQEAGSSAASTNLVCKRLTKDDIQTATEIAFAAYRDYPLFTVAKPDLKTDYAYESYLKCLLRVTIRSHILTHPAFLFFFEGKPVGLVLLEGPNDKDSGVLGYARSGGFEILFRRGLRDTFEYLDLIEKDEAFVRSIGRPHWHLEMLVIHPNYQGRGIGRSIILGDIESYVAAHGGTYLTGTTNTQQNVRLYERWGCSILHEETLSYKKITLPNWVFGKEIPPKG